MFISSSMQQNILGLTLVAFNMPAGGNYLSNFANYASNVQTQWNLTDDETMQELCRALVSSPTFQAQMAGKVTALDQAAVILANLGLSDHAALMTSTANAIETFPASNFNGYMASLIWGYTKALMSDAVAQANYPDATILLANKLSVATELSATNPVTSTDVATLKAMIVNVTTDPASVFAAKAAAITGQTFTLTTANDYFTGTSANNTFNGTYTDGNAANTFSANDVLVGGSGDDTLSISSTGIGVITLSEANWKNTPSGIENIMVTNTAAGAINFSTGAKFNNEFTTAVDLTTLGQAAGATTIDMAAFGLGGTINSTVVGAGAVTITAGSGDTVVNSTTAAGAQTISGTGLTSVILVSNGAGVQTVTGSATNIHVTQNGAGAQNITSTSSEAVTVNAIVNGIGVQTITTGEGDDIIHASNTGATINAGGGINTITLGAARAPGVVNTIIFGASADSTGAANMNKVAGFIPGQDVIQLAADSLTGLSLAATSTTGAMLTAITDTTSVATTAAVLTALASDLNNTNGHEFAASTALVGGIVTREVIFTNGAAAGTYLVINDGTAGFQATNDIVVQLVGNTASIDKVAVATSPKVFTLTTANDDFTGTSANNTFNGTFTDGNAANTFSVNDVLVGGGGTDTLSISSTGVGVITLSEANWNNTASDIENIMVTNTAAGAINFSTGAKFNNEFTTAVDLTTLGQAAGATTIDMAAFSQGGTINSTVVGAGAVTITAGSGDTVVNSTTAAGAQTISGTGLTSVILVSNGAGVQTVTGSATNIHVTQNGAGAQNITSTSSEAVTVNAIVNGIGVQTITTGEGDDIIHASNTGATINAGGGSNTITLGATRSIGEVNILIYGDSEESAGAANMNKVTGFIKGQDIIQLSADSLTGLSLAATTTTGAMLTAVTDNTSVADTASVFTALTSALNNTAGHEFAASTDTAGGIVAREVIFANGAAAGTYLVINDGTAGFGAGDIVVNLGSSASTDRVAIATTPHAFTLTINATDTFTGGSENNVFNGTFTDGNAANTFNVGDVLVGGAGDDTLSISSTGVGVITLSEANWNNTPSGIENIMVTNTAAGAINFSTGAKFNNEFTTAVDLTTLGQAAGATTIDMAAFGLGGTINSTVVGAGAVTITAGSGDTVVNSTTAAGAQTISGTGLTSVILVSNGAGVQTVTGSATNIHVTQNGAGAQNITSTSSEAVTVNAIVNGIGVQTITTGEGDDIIHASNTGATINAGGGINTITLGAARAPGVVNNIIYGASVDSAGAANMNKITGFIEDQDVIQLTNDSLLGLTLASVSTAESMLVAVTDTTSVADSAAVFTALSSALNNTVGHEFAASTALAGGIVTREVTFTNGAAAGTYLVINDGTAGFGAGDIVVHLVGNAAATGGERISLVATPLDFTLTTAADNFTGSSANNTFNGTFTDGNAANTFNVDDVLIGGGGTDTLNISSAGVGVMTLSEANWNNTASDIENIVVTNTAAGAINFSTGAKFNAEFATAVNLTTLGQAAGVTTIDMAAFGNGGTITSTVEGAGAITITTGSGATTVDATTFAGAQTITGTGVTSVNLVSNGAGVQTVTGTTGNLATVTLLQNGAGAQTVTTDYANGAMINLTNVGTGGAQTVTSGVGNDTINLLGTHLASVVTVTAGAGADAITLLAGHTANNTITYSIANTAVGADGINMDTITNFHSGLDKIQLAAGDNSASATTLTAGGLAGIYLHAADTIGAMSTAINDAATSVATIADVYAALTAQVTAGALTGSLTGPGNIQAVEVTFTSGAAAGTYLVINDATAGFQADTDMVIQLIGATSAFAVTDLSVV